MTFFDSLRDDLIDRANELAAEPPATRRSRRRWALAGFSVVVLGAGGTAAVAELTEPASKIALQTAGGPRGIADGAQPIAIRGGDDTAPWEIAAYADRAGGLGMAASTQFDPRPANGATAGEELLREIRERNGATVYGVVQIDEDPTHVVVYGAAASHIHEVQVEGRPARFADQSIALRSWNDATGLGAPLGEVRVFAADLRLGAGLTADRVNGTFTGKSIADTIVNLFSVHP